MARRTPTSPRTGAGSRAAAPGANPPAEAAPAAEGKGLTFNDALVLSTTVLMLAAFLMTDYVRGVRFGEGMFFKP